MNPQPLPTTAPAALPIGQAREFEAHLRRARRRRNQRKPAGQTVDPVLLDDHQAAALLGISVDVFRKARRAAWFSVAPVEFSPRCRRWVRAELAALVLAMPRGAAR